MERWIARVADDFFLNLYTRHRFSDFFFLPFFLFFKAAYSAVKIWVCCLISCLELYTLHNHYLTTLWKKRKFSLFVTQLKQPKRPIILSDFSSLQWNFEVTNSSRQRHHDEHYFSLVHCLIFQVEFSIRGSQYISRYWDMNSLLHLGGCVETANCSAVFNIKKSKHKLISKYVYELLISKIFPYMPSSVCVLRYIKTFLKSFVLLAFHTAVGSEHNCRSSYSIVLKQKINNILPQIFKHVHIFFNW